MHAPSSGRSGTEVTSTGIKVQPTGADISEMDPSTQGDHSIQLSTSFLARVKADAVDPSMLWSPWSPACSASSAGSI